MNKKEILYQKIYKVVANECCYKGQVFSPNIIINMGKNSVNGVDAEFLITYSADAINLPREYVVNHFPYKTYFESEGNPAYIFVIPFVLFFHIILFIFNKIRKGILFLFHHPMVQEEIKEEFKKPLTALEFADIMISILGKYQEE